VHERPRNAAAFRALGAQRLADRLCKDTSKWRLCPTNPALLRNAVMLVAQAKAKRIPLNTDRSNDNGIAWFGRACDALGTPVERPAPADADEAVESFLAAYAVYFTAMEMKPAERSAVTKLGQVRKTRADPNSALGAYYGARRVLGDFGSYLPPMRAVLDCLKGLRAQMIVDFGDDCFSHVQAQPWPQDRLEAVIHGCGSYQIPTWSPAVHNTFLDAFLFSHSLGCRKAELIRYKLSNISWLTPDLDNIDATPDGLSRVEDGWWCCIATVCSKTDYDNTKYGAQRMWFKVDKTCPWNIAARLLDRELHGRGRGASQVPISDRRHTPLFADPATGSGVTGKMLDSWLDTVKRIYVTGAIAEFLTWHSGRVTLASSLVACNKDWSRVQTLVRWESVASARIYGRAAAEAYYTDISSALRKDARGITREQIPEIDPVAAMRDIDDAIASTADDQASASTAAVKVADELRGAGKRPPPAKRSASALPKAKRLATPVAETAPAPSKVTTVIVGHNDTTSILNSDSWGAIGQTISIPEAAWSLDVTDTTRLRYLVAGLSFDTGEPLYVVQMVKGKYQGQYYRVGTDTVKCLLTAAAKRRAGAGLRRPPTAA